MPPKMNKNKPPPPPRPLLPKTGPGSGYSTPSGDAPERLMSKRQCISMACMPCRKRKSKCDGRKPSCTACTNVYQADCHYDIDSDRRRKGALKRDIKNLVEENEHRDIILEALRKAAEADVDEVVQLIRSEKSYEAIADAVENMNLNFPSASSSGRMTLEGELEEYASKPGMNKTGESLHYGHTSHLSLIGVEEALYSKNFDETASWTTVSSDVELIQHLYDLYFAWCHPFYPTFSEEAFFQGMRQRNVKYCTPLLVNAILATGCHFSDRPEVRSDVNDPSTAGDQFFAEAKRLLQEEQSCLTTVQALAVMSVRLAIAGDDSGGWKYAGQMMNMIVELGLHISFTTQPGPKMTATEIETRKITFWGCYVFQTAWGICVGRISCLPHAAITVDKPPVRTQLENKPWTPCGDPREQQLSQQSRIHTILIQNSLLAEIVNDTIHMFYAPRGRTNSRKLLQLYSRFQDWYKALPGSLAIRDEPEITLPQVITMHCYYHNCVIHLFRPFLRVSFVQSAKPPRQVCSEEAQKISDLVNLCSRTYGLRRSFVVMSQAIGTAAIQHLVDMQSPKEDIAGKGATGLAQAIRSLRDMSEASHINHKFVKLIINLTHRWTVVVPEKVKAAVDYASIGSPSSVATPSTSTSTGPTNPSDADSYDFNRRNSTSELLEPTEELSENREVVPSNQPSMQAFGEQNPFWTPFPGSFEGIPVVYPLEHSYSPQNMDISAMLDSGVNGDWGQLNRDGFTMAVPDGNR